MPEIEQMIDGKARDLGGFAVRRVLPALRRRTLGPFVFLDHMGPADHQVAVPPHPHIHLATVTYLFEGEIHHRDSLGSHQVIRPGEINWMTAGRGIVHSERGDRVGRTHGLQLWVGLPRAEEDRAPSFEHYPSSVLPEVTERGVHVRVLGGTAYGVTSPVVTASPLFYADVELADGARIGLPAGHVERGVYVVSGAMLAGNERIEPGRLAVFSREATTDLVADGAARFVVLGGEPLDGPRYMWWNFISSDRQRVIDAARAWRAGEFPKVPGDEIEVAPAPAADPRFAQDLV